MIYIIDRLTCAFLNTYRLLNKNDLIIHLTSADERSHVRVKAMDMIQEIREYSSILKKGPRTFVKPRLNMKATEVWELSNIRRRKVVYNKGYSRLSINNYTMHNINRTFFILLFFIQNIFKKSFLI